MLSVSGFPEPLRQASVESDSESSKLRGLFGRKAETRSVDSRPSTRPNTEDFGLPSPSSSGSTSSNTQTPSDEHDSYAQMVLSSQEPLPATPQRQRKVSMPRRPSSQVRKQTSLGRLEIGTGSRAVPGGLTVNALPKPPTLAKESATGGTRPTSPLRRPLPLVPNSVPAVGSSKSPALRPARAVQRTPSTKVLMSTPPRPRPHTTSPPAVSVRYQPLMVKIDTKDTPSFSPSTGSPSGQLRRLPAVPTSAVNPSPPTLPHGTRPSRVRRPRTSSGPFDSTGRRSPLDVVPSSWASRPVDLNPMPLPPRSASSSRSPSSRRALPSIQVTPRARSHSRPRRDTAVYDPPGSKVPISASPRYTRMLSPVSLASTSSPSPARTSGWTSRNVTPSTSPISSPVLHPLSPPVTRFLSAHVDPTTPSSNNAGERLTAGPPIPVDGSSSPGGLHNDEPTRDAASTLDLPIEPYVDDEDCASTMSRSPSPMEYARPNSGGSLSSLSGDSSDYSRSRSRAVRDQLRAYRKSYRGPKSPSRSPSPIQYARRSSLEALDDVTTGIPPRRRPQPRSYRFDYQAAQDSSPFVRAASAERRSSDNGSKTNSSKSISSKKRRGRSKSSRHSQASTGSVIDISIQSTVQSKLEPQRLGRPSPDHKRASRSTSEVSSRGTLLDGSSAGVRLSRSESQHGSYWKSTPGGSWEEVSSTGKKKWIDLYDDDNAVMVTTIQPNREVWKGDDVKRIIPKFRGVKP